MRDQAVQRPYHSAESRSTRAEKTRSCVGEKHNSEGASSRARRLVLATLGQIQGGGRRISKNMKEERRNSRRNEKGPIPVKNISQNSRGGMQVSHL